MDYVKEYYKKNKERIKKRMRDYRRDNPDKIKKQSRKYYDENSVNIKVYQKKHRQKFPEKKARMDRIYYLKNQNKINTYQSNYLRSRRDVDKNFDIKCRLRRNLCNAIKNYTKTGKIFSSKKYGVSYKKIIESLKPFPEDISKYHLDHLRPLCSFDLTDPLQVKEAFAPENLRWLLAEENMKKGRVDKLMSIRLSLPMVL